MSNPTTSLLSQAETLLNSKRYAEALEALKGVNPSDLDRCERGDYCLLWAECSIHVGEYSSAACVDDAIEVFRFSDATVKFAKAKYLKGLLLSSLGKHPEAKEILLEA